ncbi:MAG: M50 family metallopeptidase [bacterium]|nr:M50 family metallopeptidase [bacterium]
MRILKVFWLHILLAAMALALWDTPFLKPFRVFVVWIHEMGHAAATILTGGQVSELRVRWNESGHVISTGGIRVLISSAGYVGAACVGALLIYAGRWRLAQRVLLVAMGVTQVAMAVMFTPLWSTDFGFGVGCGALLAGIAWRFRDWAPLLATWVGVMLCLYSLHDFRTDLWMQTEQTDAGILAGAFGIPMLAYPIAFVWAAVSMWVMFLAMRGLSRKGYPNPKKSDIDLAEKI